MNLKVTVSNANLVRKINNAYQDVKEEEGLSEHIILIIELLEQKFYYLDVLLILYFAFLCFVEKPEWCL